MQRVKRKARKAKVTMGTSEIDRLKRDVASQLTDKMGLLILAATMDIVGLNEDQLCAIIKKTNLYADFVGNGVVTWEDIRKAIEKKTGVTMKGW